MLRVPAGHLCPRAQVAGNHINPGEQQHCRPSTGCLDPVLGEKESDRWVGRQPHLPAVPGRHPSLIGSLAWITTLKEHRKNKNRDMPVSVYITNCSLAMTLTIHSWSGSHVGSDIYTSHHMDAWVFWSFFFFFVPSHCKRKLMKYPLTDLTREISVMRIK